MKFILTVSALDPSGGAGESADIKVVKALGFHPCSILTALTIQNSSKLFSVHPVDPGIIEKQFDALISDFNFSAVKIGVIPNLEIAKVVSSFLKQLKCPKVLDPVIEASVGGRLGQKESYELLMKFVNVVTPNFSEARLFGESENPESLAIEIFRKFGCNVVITGGELKGKDFVCENGRVYNVEAELIFGNFHGTGCVYSTALACYLTAHILEDAARKARIFVLESVKKGFRVRDRFFVNP
ncbi:MAG: bifunctional hydroxymethylpyrimidine kinase/phosphomethylpyrimidine kinase [Archaeoglobaceae archaeon]|nr:bifunctional hydroxymethylpyrimidine kinase/phosphomethylpyrimidine kinase [Archaeoglobaceae archaeon]